MLINQIKEEQIKARKNRDTFRATVLTTLYAEAAMVGKNDGNRETTDQETIAVVKKFLKGIADTMEARGEGVATPLLYEKQILQGFLPTQYTGDELANIIIQVIADNGFNNMKQMGQVMKELNANYGGQFDGKEASTIVRAQLMA